MTHKEGRRLFWTSMALCALIVLAGWGAYQIAVDLGADWYVATVCFLLVLPASMAVGRMLTPKER